MEKSEISNVSNLDKNAGKVLFAIWSMILGIFSIVWLIGVICFGAVSIFPSIFAPPWLDFILPILKTVFLFGFLWAVLAILLGSIGIKFYKGMSITGIIMGILSFMGNMLIFLVFWGGQLNLTFSLPFFSISIN